MLGPGGSQTLRTQICLWVPLSLGVTQKGAGSG